MSLLSAKTVRTYACVSSLVLCFALAAGLAAWAQVAGTASLTGTVTDPSGAVIGSADVTASQEATGVVRNTKTDGRGRYLLPQLRPGVYQLEVKKGGFKTAVRQKLDLLVGATTNLDVQLEVGAATEQVVVEAIATGVNTTDASIGTPLSGNEVQSLPSLDLNPAGLLSLQAGVAFIPVQSDHAGGYGGVSDFDGRSGSVNGARSDQTNITLDGVDVNDPQKGYAFTSVLRVTQASLAEFRTTTTNYSPEAGGRSSSAQVQLVTKSGTNQLHGMLYYAHRNEAFNANDFFLNRSNVKQPEFRRHIYGVALGGPIIKNRFYLFGNWERLQEHLFTSSERDVPSTAFRDGVFVYKCQDLAGFAPCPTTTTNVTGLSGTTYAVPAGSYGLSPAEIAAIDPLGVPLTLSSPVITYWAGFPQPNSTGTFDGVNIVGFRSGSPVDNTFNTYIARADFHIDHADKHTLFWRGTLPKDTVHSEPQFPGLPPRQLILSNSKGFAVGYTALLSSTMVNNFRWGLTRIGDKTGGLRNSEFVDFRFISNLTLGDGGSINSLGRIIPQHHFRDDLSWSKGHHTLGMGAEARFTRTSKFSNANSFHNFLINPSWLPDGGRSIEPGATNCNRPGCFAVPANASGRSFRDGLTELLGPISQVDALYNFDKTGTTQPEGDPVRRKFAVNEYEFYFQDQWRAAPSLTLTAGLRYYVSSPPWEQKGNQVVPTPSLSNWFKCRGDSMLAGKPTSDCGLITLNLGGPVNHGAGYYSKDWNNFSPRLAFAWAPHYKDGIRGRIFGDGKMAIRGGWSLVYDRIGNGIATTFDEVGSFGLSTDITSFFGGCDIGPSGGANPVPACVRFTGLNDTAAAKAQSLQPSPGGSFPTTPPQGLLTVTSGLDDKIRTPYAHTFNFSIAREFKDYTVEATYVGRRGRKLPIIRDYAMPADLCDPASKTCAFAAARQLEALSAAGQDINTLAPIAFWENLFPGFGPSGVNQGCLQFGVFGVTGCGFSATQVAYDYMIGYHGTAAGGSGFGASTFWQDVDYFDFPSYMSCPGGTDLNGDGFPDCPNAFFPSQYVNLNTWTTVAKSEYHAMQLMLRKRMSHGFSFTLNYTLSKSLDHSSTPERQEIIGGFFTGGYTGVTINSWDLGQEYSLSDFDMRHQLNGYWMAELPFGRGKKFAAGVPGWLNQIVGGWELSGILHFQSGLPANVINGRTWPTNWDLQGNATCAPVGAPPFGLDHGPCPATQNVHFAKHNGVSTPSPNLFANPDEALKHFRFTDTGRRGERNVIRADKYSSIDLGISKGFKLPKEGHRLEFRWDIFNLANSVHFDAASLNSSIEDSSTFGDYTAVMGAPRRMQLTLRYEF